MKQIYFTSCPEGKRVDGLRGFGVRARSAGLSVERCQAAVRHAGYEFTPAGPDEAGDPPTRLEFFTAADGGRLLVHAVDAGRDAEGRPGNFFAHVLLNLPADFDARDAVRAWGADFWRRADDGGGLDLPDVDAAPVGTALTDAGLREFLAAAPGRDLLTFALAALLRPGPAGKIYVAAAADAVAWCVYGLARALPRGLLASFTFSTYEKAVLHGAVRLNGTRLPAGEELPPACFQPPNAAFNPATGRRSPPDAPAYAAAAVRALAEGRDLDAFLHTCEARHVRATEEFQDLWRLDELYEQCVRGPDPLSEEQADALARRPAALAELFGRIHAECGDEAERRLDGALHRAPAADLADALLARRLPLPGALIDRVIGSREGARLLTRPEVLERLAAAPDALARQVAWAVEDRRAGPFLDEEMRRRLGPQLGELIEAQAWRELKQGRLAAARYALEELLPRLGRRPDWMRVQDCEPGRFPDELREYLFDRLMEAGQAEALRAAVEKRPEFGAFLDALAVRSFLAHPRLDAALLRRTARALHGQEALRRRAVVALAGLLVSLPADADLLRSALDAFAAAHPDGRPGVYGDLLEELCDKEEFWELRQLSAAFALVALEGAASEGGRPWRDLARALADAAAAQGEEVLLQIARCTDAWPDEVFEEWRRLLRETRSASRGWFGKLFRR